MISINCVDDQTEILTKQRGWQYFKNLRLLDKVATLINGKLQFVYSEAYFVEQWEGDLIGCKTNKIDFLVTPNHGLYQKKVTCQDYQILRAAQIYQTKGGGVLFNNWTPFVEDEIDYFSSDFTYIIADQKTHSGKINVKYRDWYKQPYKGKVYCVQVPSGITLIRRNGKYHWSGNSIS